MATTRPATPELAGRLLVDRDVEELDSSDVAVDLLVAAVVERVVLVVAGASVLVARVEARVELEGDGEVVEVVEVVVTAGRGAESAVVGAVARGLAVGAETPVPAVLVVGVSGSRVREVEAAVEPSAGTVTSGTLAAGAARPEPARAVPETGPAVPGKAVPELAGEDRSAAPPHAANRTAAMP